MVNKIYKQTALCVFMLGLCATLMAQVQNNPPMRQVLSSDGGSSGSSFSWGTIDYTVGEPMVWTYSPAVAPFTVKHLTQGFQQHESNNNFLSISVSSVNSTCTGGNNGAITIMPVTSTGSVTYTWSPSGIFGNFVSGLAPGTYTYVVSDGNFSITDSVVILEDAVDCAEQLIIYSGVTPNGDGHNDNWQIDGITNFESNAVWIYNRWGDIVWQAKDYDNQTVVWDGKNTAGENLLDATYFYLIEVGGKTYKGWVELTH